MRSMIDFTGLLRLGVVALLLIMPACGLATVVPTSMPTPTPTPTPESIFKIMFLSRYREPGQTYFRQDVLLTDSRGGNIMNLTKSGFVESSAWSPDGQFIAFGTGPVYVVDVDGGKPVPIAKKDSGRPFSSFAWSPDGKQIAFGTVDGGGLYLVNIKKTPDGFVGNTPTLVKDGMDVYNLSWSADGMYLAFAHRSELHESTQVDILEIATGQFTNILTSTNNPTWSPDSKQIALVATMAGDNNTAVIVLFNLADLIREKGVVVPIELTPNTSSDSAPSWSPDGKSIVFISGRDGNSEIYVMNADGSNQTRLTDNPEWDAYPAWSPDSKQIAFVSNRDGNAEIYVMNADGSHLLRLTNNTADDFSPVWQPQPKP